jgi:hypothetical protein
MSSIGSIQGGTSQAHAQQAAAATKQAEEQNESAATKAAERKTAQPGRVDVRG